jgi:murein DD-endopeptidase MepM/ murein hydrolase activator NlpD
VKDKGDISITVWRAGSAFGRSINLTPRVLAVSLLVVLCLVAAGGFATVHYYQMLIRSSDYARLEAEVDLMRRSDQSFRVAARQLGDQLSSLQVTAQKLKIISGLDPDTLGGAGGPRSTSDPVLSLNQRDLSKHFRSLDRKRVTLETELRQLQDYYTTREILVAATPSIMPVRGYPTDRFGRRADPFDGSKDFHPGIDISAPKGTKVLASADGLVVFAGRRYSYGKLVSIEHKFGISTRYGHLDRYTVKAGDRVRKGDIIGYVGSTGRATGSHLHYEVRLRSQPLNPLRFLGETG